MYKTMKKINSIFALLFALLFANIAFAQVGYQRDLRGFNMYNLDVKFNLLGFDYSGGVDFYGVEDSKGDLGNYFSRHYLSKSYDLDDRLSVGVKAEYDDLSGLGNDYLRLAPVLQYTFEFGLKINAAYYAYESDGGGQKWAFGFDYAPFDWLELSGFADYHIDAEKSWVVEPQAALHLYENIWAVGTFRLNELFDGERAILGLTEKSGFGFGLVIK